MFDLVVARTETEVNIHNKVRNKIKSTIDIRGALYGRRDPYGGAVQGNRGPSQRRVSLAGDFPGAWAEHTGPGLRERVSFKRKVGLL